MKKNDMRLKMVYLCRNGEILTWEPEDEEYYDENLKSKNGSRNFDIIAVYGNAIWSRGPEDE